MKKRILIALALLGGLSLAPARADMTYFGQAAASGDVQIKPQAVPTSSTVVTSYDAWLSTITITNTTGSAVTVTVADQQASPVKLLNSVSIAANTTYVVTFPAKKEYWLPGGFTIQAGGSGLNFFAAWRQ